MAGRQRIDRARRDYNKWVADQTLEDYALRFTAKQARRWSAGRVGQTAFGAVSFLALEAIGGSITVSYGFTNATAAMFVSAIVIFASALPICIHAAKAGVDIDLLTRGAGFGYIGSTITSLIYASFTFIFFAIESVILALALELCLGIPQWVGYLLSALVVIPLVIYGISAISRFQVWTQPFFLALNVLPVLAVISRHPDVLSAWHRFGGLDNPGGAFRATSFGAALSVTIALIVQVGEQVDFLRFLPAQQRRSRGWWFALIASGPGWILPGLFKLLAGSLLAVVLLRNGVPRDLAADPPRMYAVAFGDVTGSGVAATALTCALVVICQIKINVTNAYAGSIAWSNFFSRLTHMHPGRVVWLVFNVLVALLVMELGVYRALEQTLALYSSVAVAWIGALVADLVINKPLGLSPPNIEFRRAYLYDINPVGVGAMGAATAVALLAQLGLLGVLARSLAPLLALLVALATAPLIAWATGGRFYLARTPRPAADAPSEDVCCICENRFEAEDMAPCPAYDGPICSLCCSLDARCHDACKPHGRLHVQAAAGAERLLPTFAKRIVRPHVAEFLLTFALLITLIGGVLALVGAQFLTRDQIDHADVVSALEKIFVALIIVVGVASWWFHLTRLSRRRAQQETQRQTELLFDEIEAHERTDAALKKAKEAAEAANYAKSRYVVGLSHELRTPLNAIMGYAQLLEADSALPTKPRQQAAVMRRNAGHLAALIDGLLDISKIEAGKLDLARNEVVIRQLLHQIAEPFALQAQAKGIGFKTTIAGALPLQVSVDEKRLRQILINLLSNAVKFARSGDVELTVRYRNQVAELLVRDSGPGIALSDQERIFQPFERLSGAQDQPGTGLGLTICRLLAGVMGGDIDVDSTVGQGSTFRLRLLLPRVDTGRSSSRTAFNADYGAGHRVLVVEDNGTHRDLIAAALKPVGFEVLCAETAAAGRDLAARMSPDVCLLDIHLADGNGWELATDLRAAGHTAAHIVMVSASPVEQYRFTSALPVHDAFLMKPVEFDLMHHTLSDLLSEGHSAPTEHISVDARTEDILDTIPLPSLGETERLIGLCEIGFVRDLQDALDKLVAKDPCLAAFASVVSDRLNAMDLRGAMRALERVGCALT